MALKGRKELNARLKALKLSFKPIGRSWGREGVKQMRSHVPVDTGKLRRSFRITSATQTRVRIGGFYTAYFVDAGPKPHAIKPKRAKVLAYPIGGGRTRFSRAIHHRGYRARPFRERAKMEAWRLTPAVAEVIAAWNKAA